MRRLFNDLSILALIVCALAGHHRSAAQQMAEDGNTSALDAFGIEQPSAEADVTTGPRPPPAAAAAAHVVVRRTTAAAAGERLPGIVHTNGVQFVVRDHAREDLGLFKVVGCNQCVAPARDTIGGKTSPPYRGRWPPVTALATQLRALSDTL